MVYKDNITWNLENGLTLEFLTLTENCNILEALKYTDV